jgi:hypothetical protein
VLLNNEFDILNCAGPSNGVDDLNSQFIIARRQRFQSDSSSVRNSIAIGRVVTEFALRPLIPLITCRHANVINPGRERIAMIVITREL